MSWGDNLDGVELGFDAGYLKGFQAGLEAADEHAVRLHARAGEVLDAMARIEPWGTRAERLARWERRAERVAAELDAERARLAERRQGAA